MNEEKNQMEKIVSLCKRRGFIFPGSEIYGGLSGTYDYGPLGVALKKAIQDSWWKKFITDRDDMYAVDADILMNAKVWEASGHTATFSDAMSECNNCHEKFRADQVLEKCPSCGKSGAMQDAKQFNMMFKTNIGASDDSSSVVYLRPETAPGMFVNFKNIIDTFHPKLPFGMGQIGKAFRNEINPRDFIFRLRELEQMEIEYFCHPNKWEETFEHLRSEFKSWLISLGLRSESIHEIEVEDGDRAHYSKRTIDFEFDFPIGQKELAGLAYRTDFDLKNHSEASKVDLSYFDEENKERFIPHCIEPSIGVERTVLAVIISAYREENLPAGQAGVEDEIRTVLSFSPHIAPVQVAVLPLSKKEELSVPAREIVKNLSKFARVMYDDTQSIGKRYRRQDEIGTPYCVTFDFDSLEDKKVTVRDRDSMKQDRVSIDELEHYLTKKLS
jgi:glycyl-tRNA synthetase